MKTVLILLGIAFAIYLAIVVLTALAPVIAFIANCIWTLFLVGMGIIAIGFVIGWLQSLVSNN